MFFTAAQNICFWHKADMAATLNDVRFWGKADIAQPSFIDE
jgi:hypothetical protein